MVYITSTFTTGREAYTSDMAINHNNIHYKTDAKQHKIESLFKELLFLNKNIPTDSSNPWQPPTDVYETPDEIVVKMSISGTRSEEIQVSFADETLTISGFRNDASPHEKTCFYQVEIRYGYFERCIVVPKPVDKDNIQATYKDGFLVVVLPKVLQQPAKTFSIKINIQQ